MQETIIFQTFFSLCNGLEKMQYLECNAMVEAQLSLLNVLYKYK